MTEKNLKLKFVEISLLLMFLGNISLTEGMFLVFSLIPNENLEAKDEIRKVKLFATSKYDRYGVLLNNWYDLEPLETVLEIGKSSNVRKFDFNEILQKNLCDENDIYKSIYHCLASHLSVAYSKFCEKVCLSELMKSLIPLENNITSLPECENFDEFSCMSIRIEYALSSLRGNCSDEKICKITQFKAKVESYDMALPYSNQNGINLMVSSTAFKRQVFEEYLVYDFIGMVGSVGGSLGLFVGFSIFDYLCTLIDFIYQKLNQA